MSAASERVQQETFTSAKEPDPPWTAETVAAINRDYEPLARFFPELADLLAERHRIITTDWQTASMSIIIGHTVDRAVDILDRIDFSLRAIREDLQTEHRYSRLLFSSCELLDHAAGLAAVSATLTQENERRWRIFHERVQSLTRPT